MEVKLIARKDFARLAKLSAISFHFKNEKLTMPKELEKDFDKTYEDKDLAYGLNKNIFKIIGTYMDDKLVAGAHILPYTIQFDGQDCDMAGIGGVVSDPAIRRQGAVRALFNKAFEEMKDSGQIFSYLQPLTRAFYSKFGYEMSVDKVNWTIPLEFFPKADSTGIEHYEGEDNQKQDIIKVYQSFIKDFNMPLQRDLKLSWRDFFNNIEPYKTDFHCYLHRNNQGEADAFISYKLLRNLPTEVILDATTAFHYTNLEGLKSLMAFLSTYYFHANNVTLNLPTTVDLYPLLPENKTVCKLIKREIASFGMARVIDAKAVLSCAKYIGNGNFTVKIHDEQCPWNNKQFSVKFDENSTQVAESSQSDQAIDLEVDIKAFTSLITGRHSIDEAAYIPEVIIRHNLENLRKVFYKKTLWMEEYF